MREEPDLQLAGLSIWVLGDLFRNRDNYWDGNWLNVRVRVEATEAVVEARGAIIHAAELESFTNELELLYSALEGNALLKSMEPNLKFTIQGNYLGHAKVTINVTPDHLTKSHEFIFSIDQTYFKPDRRAVRKNFVGLSNQRDA